jgi:PAS domain S-box-containing protein
MTDSETSEPSGAAAARAIARALIGAIAWPVALLDERGAVIAASPGFAKAGALTAAVADAASRPVRLPDGRLWRLIQAAESETGQTAGMLRSLIDALPAMINAKDLDSRYLLMNAYQAGLYGVGPAAAIGRTAGDFLGQDYGQHTATIDRRVVETGLPTQPYEERFADVAGSFRDVLTTKVPLRDEAGRINGVGTISIDISERKRLEAELVEANRAADRANRVKSQFFANLSHELRTPLNAIIGFSEVIAKELYGAAGNAAYVTYAKDVREAGHHLLEVINDLLDVAQIEAGALKLVSQTFELSHTLAAAIGMVSLPANAKRLRIHTAVEPGLPLVTADERRIRQVLLNLLSNAVKYSKEDGAIRIDAGLAADGGLAIAIADTGIGIAPADLEHVFRPFGRAQSAIVRAREGAGLGLPLSKALIEAHGGSLALDSTPGIGTTVRIRLPAERLGLAQR